jgi:glycosyltransferase involved in cell wall biosynthesis
MRIAYTPTRFFPRIGGIEEVCLQECLGLVGRGHEVTVVCADEPKVGDLRFRGVDIVRLPVFARFSNTPLTRGFFRAVRSIRPDVVHTHIPHPWSSDLSFFFSSFSGIPLVVTYHNDTVGKGLWSFLIGLYNAVFVTAMLFRAKRILVMSDALLSRSRILSPFRSKVTVTPPGVRSSLLELPTRKMSEPRRILFVSRLDKQHWYKGFAVLVAALNGLQGRFLCRLTVVGGGPDRAMFETQAASVRECVEFVGALSDDGLAAAYRDCDLLVLPSVCGKAEGFGLVAIEALAAGKPVVVSDVVAVSDAVRAHDLGEVVPAGDVSSLADAIVKVANRKYEPDRLRGYVKEHFSWDRHVKILEEVYFDSVKAG